MRRSLKKQNRYRRPETPKPLDKAFPGEVDTYGEVVTTVRRRHPECRCHVPCALFRCTSPLHVGRRASPWCVGGCDNTDFKVKPHGGTECSECWVKTEKVFERAGIQRLVAA